MSRSAKLKGLNLRYPIAWRDFLFRNTMSPGKLRNMMFKISHFWDEKRPTKETEDRIPTILLPASPQPAIPRPALKYFWNNRHQESAPFVLKVHPSSPSRLSVHGPLWRTSETIGVGSYAIRFKSPSQRPVTDVRPRPAPTARSDRLLKQSAWGTRAVCIKSPSQRPVTDVRPRPAPTALSDWLLKQSAQGSRVICFKSPSQRPVTDVRPRPAPTARSDWLFKQSAQGSRAICFKSPSQPPVTASRPWSALTASYDRLLKHSASEIHLIIFFESPSQRPVKAVRPQPALTARSDSHSESNFFIENCCFSKRIKPKIICNPDLIFGLAEHLVTMTLYTTLHFECATLTLHSNFGLSFYLALESTGVERNILEWSAKHTAPRKTWSNIIFFKAWIILIINKECLWSNAVIALLMIMHILSIMIWFGSHPKHKDH